MTGEAKPLLLKGGAVFDSDERSFRAGVDVLCMDGRIAAIGPDVEAPSGATTIDCRGGYVIPGLVDCHVHLSSSGEANELGQAAQEPTALRAWRMAEHARLTLHAGFTTVRDLGAREHLNVHLAEAIERGVVTGPRVIAAGQAVTMTGGHGHGFIGREADGPDEVRKAVREQLRAGARAIKLIASGGVMTPGVDPRSPSFTLEELAAGVEEGRKAFRVVAAHAQSTAGIKNAVQAGVDSIEHGVWLDEEAIEMMVDSGTVLVPTLTAPYQIVAGGKRGALPEYMVAKGEQVMEDHIASYQAAVNAGVKVAMGTDQGTPFNRPGENAQEVLRMAEHGLSPAAALLAATAWAADLLRLHDECGRLRTGLSADTVVLPEDPLEELRVLARPEAFLAVVSRGTVVTGTAQRGEDA